MQSQPACRLQRAPAGESIPLSLTPFAITIYLSLEVAGTRACSLERLVEPERESEEASVWAQCLPLTGREGACKGRWEIGPKGHGVGKGATHTGRAKTTERRWQLVTFFGDTVNHRNRSSAQGSSNPGSLSLSSKGSIKVRKARVCGETEEADILGHTSCSLCPQPHSQLASQSI